MGETLWGEMKVGDRAMVSEDLDGSATITLLPSGIPDHVRIPSETPHADAGRAFRVVDYVRAPCPACRGSERAHDAVTLLLGGSELHVAMCPIAGWCVYAFASTPASDG